MSLTSFASVLFEARVRILNLSSVQYEQVYWILFSLFALFFQTSYFFSLTNVGTSIVTSDLTLASNRTEAKLVSDISL
jgi:hypothetical protein